MTELIWFFALSPSIIMAKPRHRPATDAETVNRTENL